MSVSRKNNDHQTNGQLTSSSRGFWIGLDPGKNGGIAVLDEFLNIKAIKIPDTDHETADFLRPFAKAEYVIAVLEKVSASPQMGVVSAFTFGGSYRSLQMLLACLEIRYVEKRPQEWQKHMGCLTRGDKNVTKKKAKALFPKEKVTHATADAMLIAKYAFERYRREMNLALEIEG